MQGSSAVRVHPAKQTVSVQMVPASDLYDRVHEVSNSIARRAFEFFEDRGRALGRDLEDWFRAESQILHPVHLDIAESADALTVRAEVPGFTAKELEVVVEPHRLIISGERESNEERTGKQTLYREECSNQIYRAIDLPAQIDQSKVTATLKNGVLDLSMPKAAKAQKVAVEEKSDEIAAH